MARRRYQKGQVKLRGKSPVWVGRYREDVIGQDGTIKRVRKSIVLGTKRELPTKHLAERRLDAELNRINLPSYRPTRVATLGEFAERWQLEVLSKQKPSSIHAAKSHLKIQILPILGKIRINELGAENQQSFVTRLSGTVSRKTLLNVLGTLSSMLSTAKNWGYVTEGVSLNKLALPERGIQKAPRCFSADQAKKIILAATGQFQIMFAIAAMTALRAGEILGLMVEDFDFPNRVVHIRRSVWRGKVQTPKSVGSQAALPIPEVLATLIRDYLGNRQGFLFLNSRVKPFIAENVVRQELVPILDSLGIPRCGFHAFRHTHTSLLLATGATPKVTQTQLRHSDPRTTLGVYAHIVGDAHREAVERVASILDLSGLKLGEASSMIQ